MRHGGGQMQQAAAAALYENSGPGLPSGDAGDAVTARWLQSAGLQHLAFPMASNAVDQRMLPNLLMQGYGPQSAEEKQRIFKLMRNLNFNGEAVPEPYVQIPQSSSAFAPSEGFYSSDLRGDYGAGLLDLHSMDDTELLSDHVVSELFQPSPFMTEVTKAIESETEEIASIQQRGQTDSKTCAGLPANEKENITRENHVAKIKVVVRKRPLNKKEISRKEDDIVTVSDDAYLTVHEPKLKVDLTAFVEKHEFCFDAVLDEHVTNDQVYGTTVAPIIPTIFQRTKATCFAYGQTGSGKTYTMQPLPLRAAEDIIRCLHQPAYRNQRYKLWISFFEIYWGKLFDLLNDRKKLCMREDGRQQVCIVGLQEFEVSDVQVVKEYVEKGNAARSTGSTGANVESSRSHAILQLVVKKHPEAKESKRNNNPLNDRNESRNSRVVGKISFIDLAGSERGADTTDNDRQTRIEGAEINKSLLALKECIRALDNDQIHIPFRGSKLTEVLRDSFVGNSKTVMISCLSPNAGSCEHTLNTLRYADRVKSLSRSGNPRKDQASSLPSSVKEHSSAPTSSLTSETDDVKEQLQDSKVSLNTSRKVLQKETSSLTSETDDVKEQLQDSKVSLNTSRKVLQKETASLNVSTDYEKETPGLSSNFNLNGNEESKAAGVGLEPEGEREPEQVNVKNTTKASTSQKTPSVGYLQNSTEEKAQKVATPQQKVYREERLKKFGHGPRKDSDYTDISPALYKQLNVENSSVKSAGSKEYEPVVRPDGSINNEMIEEEEALIAAHRKEIEDTMEIVREEMKLLAEVDQPSSHIDNYVTQLSFVLSRKAASLVGLQARLARFQQRLKEQEILCQKRVHRRCSTLDNPMQ